MLGDNLRTQHGRDALAVPLLLTCMAACAEPAPPPSAPPEPVPVVHVQPNSAPPEPAPPAPSRPAASAPSQPLAKPCDEMLQIALQIAIGTREPQELTSGMKKESAFGCGTAAEGDTLLVPLLLQPRRCYTALATGFPHVSEVDLFLRLRVEPNSPKMLANIANLPLAQDHSTGHDASIAAGKDCYRIPFSFPVAAVLEVTARSGSGPMAAQVYSK